MRQIQVSNKQKYIIAGLVLVAFIIISIIIILFRKPSDSNPLESEASEVYTEIIELDTETEINESIVEPESTEFVLVKDYIPDIIVDLKYATTDNFTEELIYNFDQAYLRYGTVKKLILVADELREKGYILKIWDAYRPFAAQEFMWQVYPNANYVANPERGPMAHNLGHTVDITMVKSDGSEIPMPSGFDDFSHRASRDYTDCSEEEKSNALILQEAMEGNGFKGYEGEWWDFSDTDIYEYVEFVPPVNEELQNKLDQRKAELEKALEEKQAEEQRAAEQKAAEEAEARARQQEEEQARQKTAQEKRVEMVSNLSAAHTTNQIILVTGKTKTTADFGMYEKNTSGQWTELMYTSAFIGAEGIGNGSEYEAATPRGNHGFAKAFGVAENPGTSLPYTVVNENHYWVDEVDSDYYNQFVDISEAKFEGMNITSEHLVDEPLVYKYVLALDYNSACVKGKGSAFFLHVTNGRPTLGCIAITESEMVTVLKNVNGSCRIIIDTPENIGNY